MQTGFRLFLTRHADRLFAGLGIVAAASITAAGHFADRNGDASNPWLASSGICDLSAQLYQLARGPRSTPVSGPLYVMGGVAMAASGLGLLNLSKGSTDELVTGLLMMAAAASIFYGDELVDKARWTMRWSGLQIGSVLYTACLLPLLAAGVSHGNPFEWGAACWYLLANIAIAFKPKSQPVDGD